jgi:hypothetical protein
VVEAALSSSSGLISNTERTLLGWGIQTFPIGYLDFSGGWLRDWR